MTSTLIDGGPDKPERTVYEVECDECRDTAQGRPGELVEEGWNWADVKADGKQLGFALCPEHSTEENIRIYSNSLEDRINKGDEYARET